MAGFGSILSSALHGAAAGAGTAYDYLTPGKGSSRVTNYGEDYFVKPTTYAAPAATKVAPSTNYDPTGDIAALNKEIASEQANYQALQAQIAAQPKLPIYDTSAAWASAQKSAQAAVDPVYTDKLNQYLQQEALGTAQQTRGEANTESDIASTLANSTADNATTRTRTGEDAATKTGDVNNSETNFQTDSGTAFDRARAALLGGVANSGLTTSGLGQGKVAAATADRNQAEGEQTQAFDASRRDIATSAQRTFEDLATSDTRNTSAAATGTARAKQSLQDYIDNANLEEQGFRTNNEADRQGAISTATTQQYQTGVQQFIASLIGSGARAQDIALASQVYGA